MTLSPELDRVLRDYERAWGRGDAAGLAAKVSELSVTHLGVRRDVIAELDAILEATLEGVLVVGSGMSFHNMRGYGDPRFTPISAEFNDWLIDAAEGDPARRDALLRDWAQAPHAQLCHPPGGEEHLIPLLTAAGAARQSRGATVYSERVMETTISAFRFG